LRVLFSSGPPETDPTAGAHLERLGHQVLLEHPLIGAVQVVLTGDAEIRQLNASFRGVDQATDVLSFSYGDAPPLPAGEDAVVGEVYISLDRAAAQAAEQAVPLLEELGRLMVHGLLHLAGYEHDTEVELEAMERDTEAMLALMVPARGAAGLSGTAATGSAPDTQVAPPT